MNRGLRVLFASTLVAAGLAAIAPACVIRYDDCHDLLTCAAGGGASGCAEDADCDDHEPCTEDTCKAGACSHAPIDGPGPSDGKPCTTDRCQAGHETHAPVAAGTPCGPGSPLLCDDAGNCPPCAKDADCGTADAQSCTAPKCDAKHTCVDEVQSGKKLADATPGDCSGVFCDASGVAKPAADATDTPPPKMQACIEDACGPNGPYPPSPAGTPCTANGGKVCDGNGACVECATSSDCPAAKPICNQTTHACATQCEDGVKDGNETGVDCGGSCPLKCQGATCAADAECRTGFCADGFCCDAACNGGSCQACNLAGKQGTCSNLPASTTNAGCPAPDQACDGKGACKVQKGGPCTLDADCQSGLGCGFGACRLTGGGACVNDVECKSGLCLGITCSACTGNSLCASGDCDLATHTCLAVFGHPCASSADCATGNGTCIGGLCRVPNGGSCSNGSQCASGVCGSGQCAACATSAACGGTACVSGACLLPSGAYCASDAQCNSGSCSGFPRKCS